MSELKRRQDHMKKLFRMAYSSEFKASIFELNPSIDGKGKEVQQEPEEVFSPEGEKMLLDADRFNKNFSRELEV
jgi:hypothetical protein